MRDRKKVESLIWPVMQHRFRSPAAPPWFCRRVIERLVARAPARIPMTYGDIAAFFLPAPLLALVKSFHMSRHMVSITWDAWAAWVVIWFGLCAFIDLYRVREVWKIGSILYASAVEHVQAQLSGHERIEYLAHEQKVQERACLQAGHNRWIRLLRGHSAPWCMLGDRP